MLFKPGFRISLTDAAFLAVMLLLGGFLLLQGSAFAGTALLTATLQFFLFCNVFRIRRKPELAWAVVYLVIFGAALYREWSPWITAMLALAAGAVAIALELRHPGYHGVFWKRINPGLPEWFEAHANNAPPA